MSYINFDKAAEQMLIKHDDDKTALENLRSRYQELCNGLDGISATTYDKVGSSGGCSDGDSSIVERLAEKQLYRKKIQEKKEHLKRYDRAWDKLSEQEQKVLITFYQVKYENRQQAIDALCVDLNCERTKAYSMKSSALRRFKLLIYGE